MVKIQSAGLVQKWMKDEFGKVRSWGNSVIRGPHAFTLANLQAAFFLLLLGYGAGGLAFLPEALCPPSYYLLSASKRTLVSTQPPSAVSI